MKKILILSVFLTFAFNAFGSITKSDVLSAQKAWGDGIVHIGEVFEAKGDYRAAALDHILNSYDYDNDGTVLFKPTLAADIPFRPTVEGALSYFVGGNASYPEDKGFAIKPWTNVRFENHGMIFNDNLAVAMGHYYFTDLSGVETKVEYTLGFIKKSDGTIKINIQDSSLPFGSN